MPPRNPKRFHLILALLLTSAVAGGVWWLLGRHLHWLPMLASWLVAVNVNAFLYYGYDKRRAGTGDSRIPEIVLHALTALGGALGAWAGMSVFRHKTVKGSFRVVFWGIVIAQIALVGWLIKTWWQST